MKINFLKILAVSCILTFSMRNEIMAQTAKGAWLAEGNTGNIQFTGSKTSPRSRNTSSNDNSWNFNFALFPTLGYFVGEKVVLGTSLSFYYLQSGSELYSQNGTLTSTGESNRMNLGLTPFARYYFFTSNNLKNKLYWQIGAGASTDLFNNQKSEFYSNTGVKTGAYEYTSKGQTISGVMLIGANCFFTKNIAFNTALGYSYNKQTLTTKRTETYTGMATMNPVFTSMNTYGSIIWNFGFTFIFGRKTE